MHVEEGFLLDRIALHAPRISPRHHQASALVEAHLAHADGVRWNLAVVAARIAVHPLMVETVIQIAFARARGEDVFQRFHVLTSYQLYDMLRPMKRARREGDALRPR